MSDTIKELFEEKIVKPLGGRYDAGQYLQDLAMFSLGYNATCEERDRYKADSEALEQMTARCAGLADILSWILPLAKGYAALHRVGSNQAYCDAAEEALSDPSTSVSKLLAIKRAAEGHFEWHRDRGDGTTCSVCNAVRALKEKP